MVQVGPEASCRHQLPGHRLVEAVEEGLVLGWGLRRRSWLLSSRTWGHLPRRATLGLVRLTSGFFHVAFNITVWNGQQMVEQRWVAKETSDEGHGEWASEQPRRRRWLQRNAEINYCCSITSKRTQSSLVLLSHSSEGSSSHVMVIPGKAKLRTRCGSMPTFKTRLKPVTNWINKPNTISEGADANEWEITTITNLTDLLAAGQSQDWTAASAPEHLPKVPDYWI